MTATETIDHAGHDSRYERRAILLLGLGFGLVGLDRWIIAPLAPAIMADLSVSPQQMNNLIAVLGITWGLASIVMGGLADKIGRRPVILPAIIIFSLASGLSGMASGFAMLFLIRGMMGVAEGAFCPASFAATADAARPDRIGFGQGFQQSMFALLGLGFGPIIATRLLEHMSWRGAFMVVAIPGLLIAVALWMVLREPAAIRPAQPVAAPETGAVKACLRSHNVRLAMIGLMCAMCGIFVLSANVPIYLSDHLKLPVQDMGLVTSAIGFGGFVGLWAVPSLSDLFGRKLLAICGFVGGALALVAFQRTGAQIAPLFGWLFIASAAAFGLFSLITGPIAAESAPAGMIATSAGLISGAGEILGGGLALVVAGFMISNWGIASMLNLALGGLVLGAFAMLTLEETAPRVLSRRRAS